MRSFKLAVFAFISIVCANARAQSSDSLIVKGKAMIAAALKQEDANELFNARAHFERLLSDKSREALVHYYIAYCDYRYVTAYARRQNQPAETIDKYLEEAIAHLEKAVESNAKSAEAHALLASCYGQKIGGNPMLGMTLGPKSSAEIGTALRLEPENPRVVMLDAISKYYTPAMFGGDRDLALAGFKRSAEIFEKKNSTDPLQPDWGHAEAYAWVGMAYLDKGDKASARTALDRALAIEPDFGWVKHALYPKLETAQK
ncbi:MAG: tetratricopeptide repeat protein [bacterium]